MSEKRINQILGILFHNYVVFIMMLKNKIERIERIGRVKVTKT